MLAANERCRDGHEITTAERCKEVDAWAVSLGINPRRLPKSGNWKGVPFQCSSQAGGDFTIHFNNNSQTSNARFTSGEFVSICEKGLYHKLILCLLINFILFTFIFHVFA